MNNINNLSTALISDVLVEMGHNNQLLSSKFKPNFEGAKLFGKVRTSRLKKIESNDKYEHIYKISNFIPTMCRGEIILVANGFEDMAFFGELMSTLAVKNELGGAIIDGVTRDRQMTRNLQFPIFAKGTYPKDLKHKAIVESVDSEVVVDGVVINSGDYVFGDSDGIVIIPKELFSLCMTKCNQLFLNELKIKKLIKKGYSLQDISRECGDF